MLLSGRGGQRSAFALSPGWWQAPYGDAYSSGKKTTGGGGVNLYGLLSCGMLPEQRMWVRRCALEMLVCPAARPMKDNKPTIRKMELPKLRLLLLSLALLWFALWFFLFTSASRCFAWLSSFLSVLCFTFDSACSHSFPLLSFFLFYSFCFLNLLYFVCSFF